MTQLSRRGLAGALGAAAALVASPAAAETEESLCEVGALVARLEQQHHYRFPYCLAPTPALVVHWYQRWDVRVNWVIATAERLHPGYQVLMCAGLRESGKRQFLYMTRTEDALKRLAHGTFTLPYLATKAELESLISKHRPWEFSHPTHVNTVPGA